LEYVKRVSVVEQAEGCHFHDSFDLSPILVAKTKIRFIFEIEFAKILLVKGEKKMFVQRFERGTTQGLEPGGSTNTMVWKWA
jgi:hypothetical protein